MQNDWHTGIEKTCAINKKLFTSLQVKILEEFVDLNFSIFANTQVISNRQSFKKLPEWF